jgi:enoyl-CoA hydratase
MSSAPHLLIEKEEHVVTVIMNRPEAKNSFSTEMLVRMADAWDMIDGDEDVRVAILCGAGGTFCAGADLLRMAAEPPSDAWSERTRAEAGLHWKALLRHYRLKKPLIAAVEGYAIAGGTEILLATDVRVASASCKLGLAEARWGLFPLGGSTVRLRRQLPYTLAMELLLTGRQISAEEALRIGLIGRVVPDGEALSEAKKLARQIANNGPLAVQAIKRSVQETEGLCEEEALRRELAIGMPVFTTEDAREGPRAFAEKRTPTFQGR